MKIAVYFFAIANCVFLPPVVGQEPANSDVNTPSYSVEPDQNTAGENGVLNPFGDVVTVVESIEEDILDYREWSDQTGRFVIVAKFISAESATEAPNKRRP